MIQCVRLLFFAMLLVHLMQVHANGQSQEQSVDGTFIRDPFTPSQLMFEQAGASEAANYDVYGFRPNEGGDIEIPQMRLRGFITPEGSQEQLALLEIKGNGVFMVREGDEINIDPRQPANAIRISEISRLSITIETGTLGRIRVLR